MPPPGEPPVPEPPFPDPLAGHPDPADDPPPDEDPPADADPAEPPPQPTTNGQAPARPPQPDTGDPWCGLPPPAPDRPHDQPLLPFDPDPDPEPHADTETVGQRDVHPCADDGHDDADDVEEDCPACHGTGHIPTQPGPPAEAGLIAALADAIRTGHLKPDKLFGPATLYVHVSAHALWHTTHDHAPADTTSSSGEASGDADNPSDEPGEPTHARCPHCAAGEPLPAVTRVEDTPAGPIGPTLLDQTRQWLGHHRVSLKPVIDLNRNHAVDGYEVPAWMSEILHLSNPGSVWPYSANTSRTKDTDHTIPYQPDNNQPDEQPGHDEQPGARAAQDGDPERPVEPEQQTRLDNLGRLERRTHRVKTFGHGWQHHQPERGVHLWRSPHGHWYRVDHTGTHRLGKHPDLTEHGLSEHGPDTENPDKGDGPPA
jgi:hypothetical protein